MTELSPTKSPKRARIADPEAVPMSPVASKDSQQPIRDEYDSEEEIEGRRQSEAPLLARQSFEDGVLKSPVLAEKPKKTWRSRAKTFRERNTGLLLVCCAQIFFAGMSSSVAYLSQLSEAAVSTSELIATRMFITGLCCHLWLRWHKDPHPLLGPPGIRLLLVLRGVVGFFGLFGLYFSLRFLPLADSVVLTFLAPSLTGILASIVLKEPYRPIEALAAVISLGGVVLIAKPSVIFKEHAVEPIFVNGKEVTDQQRIAAICVALLGCCGAACAYTTLRLIGKRASPTHSIQYFSIWATLLSCLGPILLPKDQRWFIPTNPFFSVILVAVGIFGFIGQFLLTMGLARETAARGSLASFLLAPMSIVLQKLIFGRNMDMWSFLGASIIIASALVVLLTKSSKEKEPQLASAAGPVYEAALHADNTEVPPFAPSVATVDNVLDKARNA